MKAWGRTKALTYRSDYFLPLTVMLFIFTAPLWGIFSSAPSIDDKSSLSFAQKRIEDCLVGSATLSWVRIWLRGFKQNCAVFMSVTQHWKPTLVSEARWLDNLLIRYHFWNDHNASISRTYFIALVNVGKSPLIASYELREFNFRPKRENVTLEWFEEEDWLCVGLTETSWTHSPANCTLADRRRHTSSRGP